MLKKYFLQFISCHDGTVNRVLHVIGLILIVYGLLEKNLMMFLAGSVMQELGHFYQYFKTGDKKYSPLHCLKSQAIYVYPLFFAALIYILMP